MVASLAVASCASALNPAVAPGPKSSGPFSEAFTVRRPTGADSPGTEAHATSFTATCTSAGAARSTGTFACNATDCTLSGPTLGTAGASTLAIATVPSNNCGPFTPATPLIEMPCTRTRPALGTALAPAEASVMVPLNMLAPVRDTAPFTSSDFACTVPAPATPAASTAATVSAPSNRVAPTGSATPCTCTSRTCATPHTPCTDATASAGTFNDTCTGFSSGAPAMTDLRETCTGPAVSCTDAGADNCNAFCESDATSAGCNASVLCTCCRLMVSASHEPWSGIEPSAMSSCACALPFCTPPAMLTRIVVAPGCTRAIHSRAEAGRPGTVPTSSGPAAKVACTCAVSTASFGPRPVTRTMDSIGACCSEVFSEMSVCVPTGAALNESVVIPTATICGPRPSTFIGCRVALPSSRMADTSNAPPAAMPGVRSVLTVADSSTGPSTEVLNDAINPGSSVACSVMPLPSIAPEARSITASAATFTCCVSIDRCMLASVPVCNASDTVGPRSRVSTSGVLATKRCSGAVGKPCAFTEPFHVRGSAAHIAGFTPAAGRFACACICSCEGLPSTVMAAFTAMPIG